MACDRYLVEQMREVVFQHPSQKTQFENLSQPVSQPSTSHNENEEQSETSELSC